MQQAGTCALAAAARWAGKVLAIVAVHVPPFHPMGTHRKTLKHQDEMVERSEHVPNVQLPANHQPREELLHAMFAILHLQVGDSAVLKRHPT